MRKLFFSCGLVKTLKIKKLSLCSECGYLGCKHMTENKDASQTWISSMCCARTELIANMFIKALLTCQGYSMLHEKLS